MAEKEKQHWERINSTHLIEECLKRQKLEGEDENSVKIYTPDADDFVMTPDELKRFMQMNQPTKRNADEGENPRARRYPKKRLNRKVKARTYSIPFVGRIINSASTGTCLKPGSKLWHICTHIRLLMTMRLSLCRGRKSTLWTWMGLKAIAKPITTSKTQH